MKAEQYRINVTTITLSTTRVERRVFFRGAYFRGVKITNVFDWTFQGFSKTIAKKRRGKRKATLEGKNNDASESASEHCNIYKPAYDFGVTCI